MTELRRAEEQLRETLASMPSDARAMLLHVLVLPEADRAQAIGRVYGDGRLASFTELLIDLEEDPAARALVVGMLRER